MPAYQKRSGFTLIELLVVIAIIAVLAAILFPVFASVREKARQTSCASNEKQIGLAILQYTEDYDETTPLTTDDSLTWGLDWATVVAPYIKNVAIFNCPDDSKNSVIDSFLTSQPLATSSYSANAWVEFVAAGYNANVGVFSIDFSWVHNNGIQTLSSINYPASTVMIAEKHTDDCAAAGEAEGPITIAGIGDVFTGLTFDDSAFAAQDIPNGTLPQAAFPGGPNGGVSTKHGGKQMANFLFADGHVKAMIPSATDPDPVNQPQNDLWNAVRS